MKKTYLIGAGLAISSIFLFAFVLNRNPAAQQLRDKRTQLVIRKVGHLLLLQAGDSSSRILPIKKVGEGIFQLEFQNKFSFQPDTLVKIIRQNLASSDLPTNYIVSVFDCATNQMVYGFEINPFNNNLVSCQGRIQPKGCYSIQIAFIDFNSNESKSSIYQYGAGVVFISLIGFVGYGYLKSKKKPIPAPINNYPESGDYIKLGMFMLFKDQRLLKNGIETIELSDKESKLLEIFATQQNQLIERDRLLKEVWEDDGVFTARSLDVFVSKLRKKLKKDSSIQITNIYGKGYKLEIISQ